MYSATGDVFDALASPARREILVILAKSGDQPASHIARHFSMARPSVSQHLRVLRDAGLVSMKRTGRQQIYTLHTQPLTEVRDWLSQYEQFWGNTAAAVEELLVQQKKEVEGTK